MKPHIYKQSGLWCCRSFGSKTGLGYTPADAFADWYGLQYL